MLNHVITIQTNFRIKKTGRYLTKLNYNKLRELSFIEMSKWMICADNMINFRHMLNGLFLKSIAKKDVRNIMAALMIHHNPNEILNSPEENNIVETTMCNYSKNIVKYLDLLEATHTTLEYKLYRHKLKEHIKLYLDYFPIWKNIDKLFLLKNLYELYYEYEEFKNKHDTQPIITNDIIFQQLNLIARINELSNGDCQLNQQLKDVYWTILTEEIKAKSYTRFLSILTDIKQLLCAIVPSRHDLHKEIEEIVDTDYIKQMADHDAIEPSYIFNMINYLLDKLAMLQAAADDVSFNEWRESLMTQLSSNIHYYDFFPSFFCELIKRLENIYIASNKFKAELLEAQSMT